MDIAQYISSGVIEAYALGLASAEEVRELEALSAQYPEIKLAVEEAQIALEQYASLHAVAPPPEAKQQIWDKISGTEIGDEQKSAPSKVLSPKPNTNTSVYKYAAGIALLLFAGSMAYNFISTSKYEKKLQELTEHTAAMELESNRLNSELIVVRENMAIVANPAVKTVELNGVEGHTENKAMVYWDSKTKDVYLSLDNLPQPPKGKQYQLWAIVDGKPVDAGVYVANKPHSIQNMKNIPAAQMFAITLENEGGSAVPTMAEMYVAGKI